MNRILYLILFLICFSCSDNKASFTKIKPDTFIEEPGKYLLGSKQIWLKEFTDGTMIFEVGDDLNRKTLYQQSMFKLFSKYHNWIMYVDKDENIWCYNGDLQDHFVLLYDKVVKTYTSKDYVKEKIALPGPFAQELEQ